MDAGLAVTAIYRELGISEHTFYRWRKYGGMDVTDARRLRQLEDDARLKRIVADKEAPRKFESCFSSVR